MRATLRRSLWSRLSNPSTSSRSQRERGVFTLSVIASESSDHTSLWIVHRSQALWTSRRNCSTGMECCSTDRENPVSGLYRTGRFFIGRPYFSTHFLIRFSEGCLYSPPLRAPSLTKDKNRFGSNNGQTSNKG